MSLGVVVVDQGLARLGSWGKLELTGRASAVLKPAMAENLELPEAVAEDIPAGVLLLNDQTGGLLFLPYAGDLVVAYNLAEGALAYEPILLRRAADHGLRMATVRLVPQMGVLYLTESLIAAFRADCTLAWRHDADFAGWTIEGVTDGQVLLLRGDWAGNEERTSRALSDGAAVG